MPDEPKPRKVPQNPRTGQRASVDDPTTWGSFDQACGVTGAVGIGYVLSGQDRFACIDLDGCIDPDGVLSPLAQEVVQRFASYTEVSPSGTGLHVWIEGEMPGGRGRKNSVSAVEAYSESRFVTVTGQAFGAPRPIAERRDLLNQFVAANFAKRFSASVAATFEQPERAGDEEIYERGKAASNGQKFADLWAGNWQVMYSSQSEADFALVDMLWFYSRNIAQVMRVFRASGLGQRAKADRDGYLEDMIDKAADRDFEFVDSAGLIEAGREKLAASQPVDLFGQLQPPSVPTGVLPEFIEWWANAKGKELGCDAAGLAVAALVTCAAATPDKIRVRVKPGSSWEEAARIWGVLVGPPSSKKTPQINAATEPLARIDARLVREYLRKKDEYDALPPDERKTRKPPAKTRARIEDTTVEAMQDTLADSLNGVLSKQDELSGWFAGLERYGNSAGADRAAWLKAYDGGEYVVDRIKRGTRVVQNWSVSMIGAIQPEAIRKVAANTADDGLLQRFLPVILPPATVTSAEPSPQGLDDWYSQLIEGCYGFGFLSAPLEFTREAQAVQRRAEIRHNELQAIESVSPKLASHIGKYDGIFARLCVVFHVVDHLGNTLNGCPPDFQRIGRIEEAVALRVLRFMHEFLLPHAAAFYQNVLGLSSEWDRLQDLAMYIVAHKLQEIDARTVQRGDRALRSLKNDEIRPLFEQLSALGWIESVQGPRRDSTKHIVNPQVHVLFEGRARAEIDRRNKAKAELRSLFGKGGDNV
ncbi:DUF3987 domain-containing protein [Neotabrizicola sp. sgz301269]|uniref:phage NrS-1 polymerase family protein n=1 Tax=Neotabrizicola sp. sgz301269 TaxID=3276282 RepID=UPI00376FC5D4